MEVMEMIGNIYAYEEPTIYFICISDNICLDFTPNQIGHGLYETNDFNRSWWIKI